MRKLDYSLRSYVQTEQCKRTILQDRADWFGTRDYYRNLEELLWQPYLDPSSPKFKQSYYDLFASTLQHISRCVYSR